MAQRSCRWIGGLAYLVFLGAFVELALQVFYYATAGDFLFRRVGLPIYASSEISGIWNRPNLAYRHQTHEFQAVYYTNAAGLRVPEPGREFASEKPPGIRRVLLLGPSYAYGWGVDYEQSFAAQLEQELEKRGFAEGRNVEVINAGVPSLGPLPQLRWYEQVGRRYRPDLVIQLVYATMAIPTAPDTGKAVDERGYLVRDDWPAATRLRHALKKLATVFYGWVVWTRLEARLRSGDEADAGGGEVLGAGRELRIATRFDPADEHVVDSLAFYRHLAHTVRDDGSELLVVYLPLSYVVHTEDLPRWRHLGVQDVQAQMAFDADFIDHLDGIGIQALDLTRALQREADRGKRLYYWLDIHWTADGNQTAARVVAEHLTGTDGA